MNIEQTATLVAQMALIDNRRSDRDAILYFAEIFKDVDYEDAVQALLTHRRTSTEYLQPAHIIQGVNAIREERWRLFGGQYRFDQLRARRITEINLVDDPIAYRDAIRALTDDIRSGRLTKADAIAEIEA